MAGKVQAEGRGTAGDIRIFAGGSDQILEGMDVPSCHFGGNEDNDNSGILKYVRVWYGGKSGSYPMEGRIVSRSLNGITLAGR